MGEALEGGYSPLGYRDDRHVCLISGSRGGKGVGLIVPNLCFWPGSAIIVDPKGENATVTARRRGGGSAYSHGMGQKVRVLDPFGEADVPDELKARYNPLDAIDPESDYAVDDAARVASSLVVVQSRNDPYWEEAARNLIKGIILHVLSASYLAQHRNLVTIRRLLTQGDWLTAETLRQAGDEKIPTPMELLWSRMRRNTAFNGVVAGVGEQMIAMADRQRSGVLAAAYTSTEFLDSVPMQRVLQQSDFDLSELKTNGSGLTIYLTLPARYMDTHYRWLRVIITLAIGEMERIKGRPATGHPTLFLLDEFAGMRRMEIVEHAAAQAAGFGVKFLFVVQNLPQIEDLYEKSWETFLGNSGLKLFFQIDDDFTRQYIARQLGELETTRRTESGSHSQSSSDSTTAGENYSTTDGRSTSRRPILHFRTSKQSSWGSSQGTSTSRSKGSSDSATAGWSESIHKRPLLNPDEIGRMLARVDDPARASYPGLVLALIPGEFPLLVRRVNYYESDRFLGYFDPHPNHPPPPTLAELRTRAETAPLPPPRTAPEPSLGSWEKRAAVGIVSLVVLVVAILLFTTAPQQNSAAPAAAVSPVATPPPAEPAPPPAPSKAYIAGGADWYTMRSWYAVLFGDRRVGAEWYAAHRSVAGHASCNDAAASQKTDAQAIALFAGGCRDAKEILDRIDAKRADPQYRAGFNDEAKRNPM
jgi:type IV secretory pathway TraG/TraD family ATPase VirD4